MKFYVVIDDEQQGPYTIDELANFGITPETEVWTEGMDDWGTAADVPQLDRLFEQRNDEPQAEDAINDTVFYVFLDEEQQGPFSIEELSDMGITPETEVWAEGMDDWTDAANVPQLKDILVDYGGEEKYYEEFDESETYSSSVEKNTFGNSSNKKLLFTTACILALLLILFLTNPSKQKHVEVVTQNIAKYFNGMVDNYTGAMGLGDAVGNMTKASINGISQGEISEHFSTSNFVVCSIGHIRDRNVSFGILGMVFCFDGWLDDIISGNIDRNESANIANDNNDISLPEDTVSAIDPVDAAAEALDAEALEAEAATIVEGYPSIYDQSTYHFTGTIAGSPVVMDIQNNEGQLTGSYFYQKNGPRNRLQLNGDMDFEGNITISEYNPSNGINSGYMEGYLNEAGDFSGTFTNSRGNSYSFHLHL